MEDVAYAKNGISETEASSDPIVLIPTMDNSIKSGSQMSDHLTNNDSTNDTVTNKEYQNGISPVSEIAGCDNLLDDYASILVENEVNSDSKVVPPTIFENAVKVVKNFFSPAKGHGIFLRNTPHALMDMHDMKKTANEGSHPIGKSLISRLDEVSLTEDTKRVSLLTILENNVNQNEEDFGNTTVKNTSNSISIHDNTNDSYTTTVSIMDDSFQSTITHFDENMQNEKEKVTESVITVEHSLYGTLNDTIKSNENSWDNTLMKNVSICSTINGDLNGTFEVDAISKVEDEGFKELNLDKETENTEKEYSEYTLPDTENIERDQKVKGFASMPEGNFLSFQQEGMLKIGTFSSTPSKEVLSDELSFSEKSFTNSLCEKGQECGQNNGNNIDPLICAEKNANNTKPSQPSGVNQSSEHELLFFSIRNKNRFPEKSSTPKLAEMEKNFSTSTIILTKNASETLDISSVREEEKELISTTFDNVQKVEVDMQNDTNFIKFEMSENRCQESNSNILEKNILSSCLEKGMITGDTKKKDGLEVELNVGHIDKNSTVNESNSSEDVRSSCSKPDVNIHALGLSSDSETSRLKPEGYPTDETRIPLASQKSYTVLHNSNPDLNRPIVLDYMCDVQAEKLNDIILGNCAFSDLPQFNNYSEELISDVAQTASQLYDSRGLVTPNNPKPEKIESKNVKFESSDPKKEIVDLKISEISTEVNDVLINGKQKFDVCEVLPLSKKIDSTESIVDVKIFDQADNLTAVNIQSQSGATAEAEILENKNDLAVHQDSVLTVENYSKPDQGDVKEEEEETILTTSTATPALTDRFQNISVTENNVLAIKFCGDGSLSSTENVEPFIRNENQIFREDSTILNNSTARAEMTDLQTQMEKVATDLERLAMNDSLKKDTGENCVRNSDTFPGFSGPLVSSEQSTSCENSKNAAKESISGSDAELTQFIQEQFSAFDIEKICSVVDDVSELNLSKNIVLASQQFDKSFQEKIIESDCSKPSNFVIGDDKSLSSALDFLDSIKGKPTGRDFSRESLYVKFDPLVQSKHSAGLLNISEGDKENLIISPGPKNSGSTEPLIPITPLKQAINVNSPLSPLTPFTQKNEPKLSNEKLNKIRELQSEITRSREMFLQMEEVNKEKMNNYEREVAKLTGRTCVLEDKLKESEEMEKTLIKKLNVQNESINRLKNIMDEYLTYIGKLTDQMETEKMKSHKKMKILTEERDYYMNHLQNTEQAFSDVHSKYEKCKKAVEIYKKNEETYKTSIEDFKERIEQYREKIKDIQENAGKEMNRLQEKMNDMKANHAQEISRFKAQLRKMELKVQTTQEALDRKVKENQGLARICDELIDGKKRNC